MHVPKQVLVALLLVSSCTCERGERPTQIGAPDTTAPRGSETEGRSEGVGPSPTEAPSKSLPRGEPVRLATRQDCGIWADNSVWCWDHLCAAGETCYPHRLEVDVPAAGATVTDVVKSGNYYCVLLDNGEVRFSADSVEKDTICRADVLGKYEISALVETSKQSCALTRDGRVLCWEVPVPGAWRAQPGLIETLESRLVLADAVHLDSLHQFCAASKDGSVWCWGEDDHGPARAIRDVPPSSKVAVGSSHTCALTVSGEVYCWGNNTFGQLGIGRLPYVGHDPHEEAKNPHDYRLPQRVAGLSAARQLVSRGDFSCAITRGDAVYCWGTYGAHGTSTPRLFYPNASQVEMWTLGICLMSVDNRTYYWSGRGSESGIPTPELRRLDWAGADLR